MQASGLILVALFSAAVSYLALLHFSSSSSSCVVVVTGESFRISGCDFTEEFIGFAKTLRVANLQP